MNYRSLTAIAIASLSLSIGACSSENDQDVQLTRESLAEKKSLRSAVLAEVNNTAITQTDLDLMIAKLMGENAQTVLPQSAKDNVLRSLVASEAMRQKLESTLSSSEKERLAAQARAYETELYVKEFLTRYSKPETITSAMVKDYYQQNLDQFRPAAVTRYEMLVSGTVLESEALDAFKQDLASLPANASLKMLAGKTYGGASLRFVVAESKENLLSNKQTAVLAASAIGNVTEPVITTTQTAAFKVLTRQTQPPASLDQVGDDIRKKLAPLQVKKAVEQATKTALTDANVIYRTK